MIDGSETFHWQQLAGRQKLYIAAGALLLLIILGGVAWDSISARLETSRFEREAAEAQRQKDEALEAAAKIAGEIRIKEDELLKVEVKRDAKSDEVKSVKADVDRRRADYDAARQQRTKPSEAPSSDELCARLAALGHPCNPR
jgi:flagellar biosynthesis/type III secretory pathway M-ring protein FliF/YscJ